MKLLHILLLVSIMSTVSPYLSAAKEIPREIKYDAYSLLDYGKAKNLKEAIFFAFEQERSLKRNLTFRPTIFDKGYIKYVIQNIIEKGGPAILSIGGAAVLGTTGYITLSLLIKLVKYLRKDKSATSTLTKLIMGGISLGSGLLVMRSQIGQNTIFDIMNAYYNATWA